MQQMKTYHRIKGRHVVHTESKCCHYVLATTLGREITRSDKRPAGCTVCDFCQALERRERKARAK